MTLLFMACSSSAQRPTGSYGGPTLDQWGGRIDISCTNTTGFFIMQKVANKWWFCDPAGHGFFMIGAGNVPGGTTSPDCAGNANSNIITNKYGDTTFNMAYQTEKIEAYLNINSQNQDSSSYLYNNTNASKCSGCAWPTGKNPLPMPFFIETKTTQNLGVNRWGTGAQPMHDMLQLLTNAYTGWQGAGEYDSFTTGDIYGDMHFELIGANGYDITDPYWLGIVDIDTDFFWGSGGGTDIDNGDTNSRTAIIVLLSPTGNYMAPLAPSFQNEVLFPQQQNILSKMQATNPAHGTCSVSHPCSLRDYFYDVYSGSVSAMNAAIGSSYTSFDSAEVTAPQETPTLGSVYTLAHSDVTPWKMGLFFKSNGGSPILVGGDCPWLSGQTSGTDRGCPNNASGVGAMFNPPLWSGENSLCTNTGYSHDSSLCGKATPAVRIVGDVILDSKGNLEEVTTAGCIGSNEPTWATTAGSTTTEGACSTNPAFINTPAVYTLIGPGLAQTAANSVNYTNGTLNLTLCTTGSCVAMPAGASYVVNYTYHGWCTTGGTGFTDTCGKNISGVEATIGTGSWCLFPQASDPYPQYWACGAAGSRGAKPVTINQALAAVIDAWEPEYYAEWAKTDKAAVNQIFSASRPANASLFFGMDELGTGGGIPNARVLQGAGPYVDVAYVNNTPEIFNTATCPTCNQKVQFAQDDNYIAANWQYLTQNLGDVPILFYDGNESGSSDSSNYCDFYNVNPLPPTGNGHRANNYYHLMDYYLTHTSANGDSPMVGVSWWDWVDLQKSGFGLLTIHYNVEDGQQNTLTSQTCPSYYTANQNCGGESDTPVAPSLSTVAGSCPGGTEFLELTYVTAAGETKPGPSASITTSSSCAKVSNFGGVWSQATGINIYASATGVAGSFTLQNATKLPQLCVTAPCTTTQAGVLSARNNWTEPASGFTTNGAVAPTTDTSGFVSYGNIVDIYRTANMLWRTLIGSSKSAVTVR